MVLEIQFQSIKCAAAARIRKHSEQLFISIQAMQGDYSVQLSTNHFKKFLNVFILYMHD